MGQEKIKYLLYAEPQWLVNSFPGLPTNKTVMRKEDFPQPMQTGLFQWINVFDGDVGTPELKELKDYDIIHMNLPPTNYGKARFIKEYVGNKTKVVVNIDHAIDLWHTNGYNRIDILKKEIESVDLAFCTEINASNMLSEIFGIRIPTIPHPVDYKYLSNIKKIEGKETKHIIVVSHRYDLNWLIPMLSVNSYLIKNKDKYLTTFVGALPDNPFDIYDSFDIVHSALPFSQMIEYLNSADLVVDTAITRSYGRIVLECASMRVPCITNKSVMLGRELFNDLSIDIYNIKEMHSAMAWVLKTNQNSTDKSVYGSVSNVERYSAENSKERLLGYL